ncbi:MAG TPA: hypothetical protein VK612_13585 [Pyrinomonadaceae bacterium]|nr:hypothetical protein [Pyrinomonadaceae bacterium]
MNLENEFRFESYGVKIGIECDRIELLRRAEAVIRKSLVGKIKDIENSEVDHTFGITLDDNRTYTLYQNGEKNTHGDSERNFFKFFGSIIRLTVAEFARDLVFVHAGVVGWNGGAIVLPGRSFQGKTTVVAELVRAGATYLSDEYAIFDENGYVHSFPRPLAMRGIEGEYIQTDISVDELGGTFADGPLPVKMIVFTEFREDAVWIPETLSPGLGIVEMVPHTIPIRFNPEFALKVLKIIVNRAIIAKSFRNDAKEFTKILLNFFDITVV